MSQKFRIQMSGLHLKKMDFIMLIANCFFSTGDQDALRLQKLNGQEKCVKKEEADQMCK